MTTGTDNETAVGTPSLTFRRAGSLLLLWLALTLISYGAGSVYMNYQASRLYASIDEAEAMLRFNHLLTFRDLEADLSAGCSKAALEKTKWGIDQEMMLLADFQKERPDSWAHAYMAKSDPELPGRLRTFKRRYPDSWKVPQCRGRAAAKADCGSGCACSSSGR